ncbi:uncharacterized protein EI90DRAFT_3021920 [Cantharellus anzutake]|uniref:uncharacterized protein n=1 Tax=Cantharellus anzutake TaxID=1750568 RepID=UPI001903E170|nr:uncharacterized protein EI90DRAFT_3021920 [Cantharellus anzutake]KAF8315529.1 hypothetical protein EI90DRAFT_3021920 [Cantharellus anzutake]
MEGVSRCSIRDQPKASCKKKKHGSVPQSKYHSAKGSQESASDRSSCVLVVAVFPALTPPTSSLTLPWIIRFPVPSSISSAFVSFWTTCDPWAPQSVGVARGLFNLRLGGSLASAILGETYGHQLGIALSFAALQSDQNNAVDTVLAKLTHSSLAQFHGNLTPVTLVLRDTLEQICQSICE